MTAWYRHVARCVCLSLGLISVYSGTGNAEVDPSAVALWDVVPEQTETVMPEKPGPFCFDGQGITWRVHATRDWYWNADDDIYRFKAKWNGDDLYWRTPSDKWERFARWRGGRFEIERDGIRWRFAKVNDPQHWREYQQYLLGREIKGVRKEP